jgi:RNA-directed DNA polymerase
VLDLVRTILAGSDDSATTGRGLPIGSLTSQWLANITLDRVDRLATAHPGIGGYLRYMDDMALFADDKASLHDAHAAIAALLRDPLGLQLKPSATRLAPTSEGLPFLGFAVFPGTVRLRPATRQRLAWRLRFLRRRLHRGTLAPTGYRHAVAAVLAHAGHADTRELRRRWWTRAADHVGETDREHDPDLGT